MPATAKMRSLTPLAATQEVLDISATEREQFRSCRRRWKLQTLDNLEPKRPRWELTFGTGMHEALEKYYNLRAAGGNTNALLGAKQALNAWYKRELALAGQNAVTVPEGIESDEVTLEDLVTMGYEMLDHYDTFDRASSVNLGNVLAIEGHIPMEVDLKAKKVQQYIGSLSRDVAMMHGRHMVPILNPNTGKKLPRSPWLSGRIDLLTYDASPGRGLWIVDHKTLARPASDRGLDFDDQVTAYCYIVWRWTGIIPRGVIYNVLIKDVPKEPRILKDGSLSTAKDQRTTPDMYRDALREHGLLDKRGTVTSDKHAECMDALLARGWDPFFQRMTVSRNEEQLRAFERYLVEEYKDMRKVRSKLEMQYPNPSAYKCGYCPVNRICQAMSDGSDVEYITEHEFQQGIDRKLGY